MTDANEELFRERLDGLQNIRAMILDVKSYSCSSACDELYYALQRIQYATEATIREQELRKKLQETNKRLAEERLKEPERRINGC